MEVLIVTLSVHLPGTPPSPTPLSSPVPGIAARYRTDPCADEHPGVIIKRQVSAPRKHQGFFFLPLRIPKDVFFFLSPTFISRLLGNPGRTSIHQFPLGMFGCMDAGRPAW
jgi:hypothetical protein